MPHSRATFSMPLPARNSWNCWIVSFSRRNRPDSKVLFGELAKLIWNGPGWSQYDRTVSDRVPSETIADQVNSAVCRPTRHPALRAWPAFFIFKSKWKFELQFPVLLKMGQRDRQQ